MCRLLAIAFTLGLVGMLASGARADCFQVSVGCSKYCDADQTSVTNSCARTCRRTIICDTKRDGYVKDWLLKSALPSDRLPQSKLPLSRLPQSAFN